MRRSRIFALLVVACALLNFDTRAASLNESVDGDLSNIGLTPTSLPVGDGNNFVRGGMGGGDLDYLTFALPTGFQLDAIMVMSDTVIAGGIRSFVGVQAGSVMTVLPNAGTPEGLLGYTHFDFGSFGQNILPGIGEGFGSTGFIAPLPAGAYTFWIQDTGAELGSYHLNFQVSAVPEPVSAWMTLVGLGLICSRRRATGLVRPESESQSRGRCARIGRRISTSGIQTA